MTDQRKHVVSFIVIISVLGAIPFLLWALEQKEERMSQEKYEEVVQETVQLIRAGSYKEAEYKLDEIPEGKEDKVTENLGRYVEMLWDERIKASIEKLESEANTIEVEYGGDLKEKMEQDVERIHTAYQKYEEQREEEKRLVEEAVQKIMEEQRQYLYQNTDTPNYSYSGSSSYSKPSKSYTYNDPYDAREYDDPEDFYYDNEDLFDDYEDAEDEWDDAWDD